MFFKKARPPAWALEVFTLQKGGGEGMERGK
jgi:hypothetical protein